jgi:hypothetical protein
MPASQLSDGFSVCGTKRNPGKIVKAGNSNSLNNAFKQNNINDKS